jgi:putative ABC transport system permease protein
MSNLSRPNSVAGRILVAVRKIPRPILAVSLAFALGLAINTAIFTLGYLDFLEVCPHADELVRLRPEMQGEGVLAEDFLKWRQQTTVFQYLEASAEDSLRITTQRGEERLTASSVTPGFYRMMGDRFYLGSDFGSNFGSDLDSVEGTQGRDRAVILTHAMWKRLGANPSIIGAALIVNGEPYTVAGVLAPGLRDQGAPVTVPLVLNPEGYGKDDQRVNVIGRLKPGVSLREAQANLDSIAARIPHSLSNSNRALSVSVKSLRGTPLASGRNLANWLLLGGVGFVLLVECVSVANLLKLRADASYQLHS